MSLSWRRVCLALWITLGLIVLVMIYKMITLPNVVEALRTIF